MENDQVQFVSTSMQAQLEEMEQEEQIRKSQSKSISSLESFKNASSVKPKKAVIRKTYESKRSRGRKIKSITALMNDKYGKTNYKEKDEYTQLSILKFFSGKKHKISDIIKRIQDVEMTSEIDTIDNSLDYMNDKFIYSESEWKDILQNIKLKFPSLSKNTKQSLKYLTHKMREQEQLNDDSIWSKSASLPKEDELNSEDVKWLYDLENDEEEKEYSEIFNSFNEDEMNAPFALTLSQALENKGPVLSSTEFANEPNDSNGSNEIISDSSPEPTQLEMPPKLQIQETAEYGPISSHQPESMFFCDSNSLQNTKVITSSKVEDTPLSSPRYNRRTEEVYSSFIDKQQQQQEEVMSSPIIATADFKTPTKLQQSHELAEDELIDSPINSNQSATQYSTATSHSLLGVINSPSKKARVITPQKIKKFKTTIHEIHGSIQIRDYSFNRINVRKVGTRRQQPIDSEEEIEDSEDDFDTSISILEINREVEIPSNNFNKGPILQIPSSP